MPDITELPVMRAADATAIGFAQFNDVPHKVAEGRLVRPWITWEIEDAGENHRELDHDDLLALGFQPTLETAIAIDPA